MPITAANKGLYPPDWSQIATGVKEKAGWKCETCKAPHNALIARSSRDKSYMLEDGAVFDEDTGEAKGYARGSEYPYDRFVMVVITVAHLDHHPTNSDPANLKALCQQCHNRYDGPHRAKNAAATRRAKMAAGDLFDGAYSLPEPAQAPAPFLPTITLYQPWASLALILPKPDEEEPKPDETRSRPFPPKYLGRPVAIHAAAAPVSPRLISDELHEVCMEIWGCGYHESLTLGCVLGVATLAEAMPTERARELRSQTQLAAGDYGPGRWAWRLTNKQTFEKPIPAKGSQGWWFWTPPASFPIERYS